MPERAAIFQGITLGVEGASTPGTAVAPTKRLLGVSLEPDPQVNIDAFKPAGSKWLGVAVPGQKSSAFRVGGRVVYDELHYLLASVLTNAAPTTPGTPASPLAREWRYVAATSAPDAPASYTVEQGAAAATDGNRYAGVYIAELGLTFTRQSVEVSGTGLGQALLNPATMASGGVTDLPQVPALPKTVDVFWDTTSAGLGTTKLLRCFRVEWRVAGRYTPIWPLNSANPSWERVVEGDPSMSATIRAVADAQGMAFYNTYMEQGAAGYLRVRSQGNFIDALPTVAITSSTAASPPVFTSAASHNLAVGETVVIAGHSVAGYNGTWVVATAPTGTTFTLKDPVTGALMANLGAGTGGTLAEQVNPYLCQVDMCALVTGVGGFQIDQDLQMIEFTLSAKHDSGWAGGRSHEVTVRNKQVSL